MSPRRLVAVHAAARVPVRSDPARVASVYKPESNGVWLAAAIAWVCLGHGVVLVSSRSSARESEPTALSSAGSSGSLWHRSAIGSIATMVLPDTSFNNTTFFTLLVTIDVTLRWQQHSPRGERCIRSMRRALGIATAGWRITCRRSWPLHTARNCSNNCRSLSVATRRA